MLNILLFLIMNYFLVYFEEHYHVNVIFPNMSMLSLETKTMNSDKTKVYCSFRRDTTTTGDCLMIKVKNRILCIFQDTKTHIAIWHGLQAVIWGTN